MNEKDQKVINKMISELEGMNATIEEMRDRYQEQYDGMSERVQESERGEALAACINELEGCDLQTIIDALGSAKGDE